MMTGEQGVKAVEITQTPHRHPDPLQRLLGIPVGTRRLQEGRPGLDHQHEGVYLAHGETYTFKPNG
jgi:hypothetical protein